MNQIMNLLFKQKLNMESFVTEITSNICMIYMRKTKVLEHKI